jgi:hypothetical protein
MISERQPRFDPYIPFRSKTWLMAHKHPDSRVTTRGSQVTPRTLARFHGHFTCKNLPFGQSSRRSHSPQVQALRKESPAWPGSASVGSYVSRRLSRKSHAVRIASNGHSACHVECCEWQIRLLLLHPPPFWFLMRDVSQTISIFGIVYHLFSPANPAIATVRISQYHGLCSSCNTAKMPYIMIFPVHRQPPLLKSGPRPS